MIQISFTNLEVENGPCSYKGGSEMLHRKINMDHNLPFKDWFVICIKNCIKQFEYN